MKYENKSLSITSWAEEDRPREKLMQRGQNQLTDAELLGILIRAGTRSMSAVDLAKHILSSVNNDLEELARMSVKDLMKYKGMGEAKAITIKAALEIGKRRKPHGASDRIAIRESSQIYHLMRPHLMDLTVEEFWVILLNRANVVMKKQQISSGGVSGTVADPKIIFKAALDHLATGIILVHNHPSGNLSPSIADKNLTQKIKNGASFFDITLIDHVIFTNAGYFSFCDEGLI